MRKAVVFTLVLLLAASAGWYFSSTGLGPASTTHPHVGAESSVPSASSTAKHQDLVPDGIPAPDDLAPQGLPSDAGATPRKASFQNAGRALPVKADASPQAASVAAALRTTQHSERVAALLPSAPFDPAAFEKNPAAYLNTVEPGRVFQCAQPRQDVPALVAEGARMLALTTGEKVRLKVRGAPWAPVSFTSFDMGTFSESQLNCVTVRADQEGLAAVTFVATPGTVNDCNILAGSPMASGQARFVVEIHAHE